MHGQVYIGTRNYMHHRQALFESSATGLVIYMSQSTRRTSIPHASHLASMPAHARGGRPAGLDSRHRSLLS